MGFAVRFCLSLLIVTGSLPVDALWEEYISVISDVYMLYNTSSVWFSFSRDNWRLGEFTSLHVLSRDLSRRGVATLTINFDGLPRWTNIYRRRIARPLIVVSLTAMSDIDEFIGATAAIDISYPIWLVIFTDEYNESAVCACCEGPPGNIFHLRFNTEMLIMCCKNRTLNEWWSVKNNRTEMANFANWNDNGGLTLLTPQELYARRHNLDGAGLRVGIVTSSAFLRDRGDKIDGLLGDVLTELKRVMNFTIISTIREPGFGSWNSETKSWSGVVGYLARGQADIGVGEFTITDNRLDAVDFTLPLILSPNRLYIKVPDRSGVQWTAYFEAFALEIWLTIILLITITPVLLTTVIRAKRSSKLPLLVFLENYLYVWGIFCQQGLSEFPAETPLRVAFTSIFFSAVVVSAAYSASLISFLTVYSASLPFSSLSGFASDGSYKLVVYQNSSDYDLFAAASDPVLEKMMTQMKPWRDLPQTVEQGFEQVCDESVAFFTTEAGKQTMAIRLPCQVTAIESGHSDSLAMITAANSQYTGVVNYFIQRFQDNGMINRLKLRYIISGEPSETTHDVVTLGGVAPVLSVLAGGIVLASAILLIEKIYHRLKSDRQPNNVHVRKTVVHRLYGFHGKRRTLQRRHPRFRKFSNVVGYYP